MAGLFADRARRVDDVSGEHEDLFASVLARMRGFHAEDLTSTHELARGLLARSFVSGVQIGKPFRLYRERGGRSASVVFEALRREHLDWHARSWRPRLRQRGALDADWPWADEFRSSDPSREMFALVERKKRDRLHGLLSSRVGLPSWIDPAQRVVYCERLAVAPWNRVEKKPRRELLGCGSALLALAVSRSVVFGHGGRVGLHSLRDADTERFYERCGMTAVFRDPFEGGELYFEFTTERAQSFMEVVDAKE